MGTERIETDYRAYNLLELVKLGGNIFDYFIDRGIKKITVFTVNEYGAYIVKEAEKSGIETVQALSSSDLTVSFKYGNLKDVSFVDYTRAAPINEPVFAACHGHYFPWGKINTPLENIFLSDYLYSYSIVKHTVIAAIEKIKRDKKINAVLCRLPNTWDMREQSSVEQAFNRGDRSVNSMDWLYESTFKTVGMSKDEFDLILKEYKFNPVKRGGVTYASDTESQTCNVINGYRVTADVPAEAENRLFMFGNSALFGWLTKDSDTIASCLQRELNEISGSKTEVVNCANQGGANFKEMAIRAENENIRGGDTVVFLSQHFSPLFSDYSGDLFRFLDFVPVFQRPHNYGEIFCQHQHYLPNAHRIIAEKLCNYISAMM